MFVQLNIEQKKIIQSKPNGNILVKGVAGSGKTTVAVNRIPFLLNHYCFEADDNILMVTYNKLLVNYITHIFDKIEIKEELDQTLYRKDSNTHLSIETVDGLMYKYFVEYNRKNGNQLKIVSGMAPYNILAKSIAEISKSHTDIKLLTQKYSKFLLDEIEWIKACNYTERIEYQNADRIGRTSIATDGPQRIMKNSPTRAAIYDLMIRYNENLSAEGYIDFKDMALIAYNYAKENIKQKYTHILLDEGQDLTRVQLEFIKLLYKDKEHSSIMFICDTAQSIYQHSWLVKGRSFTSVGFDMTGKSNSLSKNYRTTTQIAEAAYSLIEKDENIIENENYVKPSLIDRQGVYPICQCFHNEKNELEFIRQELTSHIMKEYNRKDIAIIARTKNKLEFIQKELQAVGIPSDMIDGKKSDFDKDSLKLLTMHSIKGLEFKVVFIIGLNADTIPFLSYQDLNDESLQESMDRKLLYVGMTRANEMLYMSTSARPSKFIGDINNKYLKINRASKIKRYYEINIQDYLFQDKIVDMYSNEEKIRQWFIKELINTYKYPENLISIEYGVNTFSKVGFVDICVRIYKNGKLIPYIFIEIKSHGQNMEQGTKQLESYMSNSLTCKYGVIVNGNDIKIFNRELQEQTDMPSFNSLMLPSSIESYRYLSISKDNEKIITRDTNNPDYIVVEEGDEKINYSKEGLAAISVFTKIAAGDPISVNEEIVDTFPVPKEWVQNNDFYMLSVQGDSMIGANIHDGDHVLIKQQDAAENRDVIVAMIGENVTLKRFIKMGDTILLMPENSDYEPIQLTGEQFRVLGVVKGIMKAI